MAWHSEDMKAIQLGDTGRDVEVWQRFLVQTWSAESDTMMPGVFDEATEAATQAFQTRHGIDPSGLVDRHTIAQAELLGLSGVETLVPKGISKVTGLAVLAMIVMLSLLSQCMLAPTSSRLPPVPSNPLDNPRTPGAPVRSACPGWFC